MRWGSGEVLLEVKEFHAEPGELRGGIGKIGWQVPIHISTREP